MTESEEFGDALLLAILLLTEDDDVLSEVGYVEAMEKATVVAKHRTGTRELAFSTQRNVRSRLAKEGLIDFRERRRHYTINLTEEGYERVEGLSDPGEKVERAAEVPPRPFRFAGPTHRLSRRAYGDLMRMVKEGGVELIAVDSGTRTRAVGYWDE
jgi:hypothetical protein